MSFEMIVLISSVIISVVVISGYFLLAYRMGHEVLRPKDGLTPLRWRLFWTTVAILLTLLPSLLYRMLQLYGHETEAMLNLTRIVTSINAIITLWLIFSIFTYRKKD